MKRQFGISVIFSILFALGVPNASIASDLSEFSAEEAREFLDARFSTINLLDKHNCFATLDSIRILMELHALDTFKVEYYFYYGFAKADFEQNYALGLEYFRNAEKFARQYGKRGFEQDALLQIAQVYYNAGMLDTAIHYGLQCLEVAKAENDIRRIATANSVMAANHGKDDLFKIDLLKDAYKYVKHIKHNNVAIILNNLGNTYLDLEIPEVDSSVKYLQLANELQDDLGTKSLNGIKTNLATAYYEAGEYNLADSLLNLVIERNPELAPFEQVHQYFYRAKLASTGKPPADIEIESNLKKLKNYIVETNYDGYGTLSEMAIFAKDYYKDKGNLEEFAYWSEVHTNAIDSLRTEDAEKQISKAKVSLALSDKDKEVRKYVALSNNRLLIIFGLLLTLLLLTGLLKMYYDREKSEKQLRAQEVKTVLAQKQSKTAETDKLNTLREMQSLQKEVIEKDEGLRQRKILSQLVNIKHRDELLKQVSNDLSNLRSEATEPIDQELQKVVRKIEGSIKSDSYREKFLLHFEQVHPDFYQKLGQKYPDLNNSEKRLLGYIKMQLSSKEIAQILGVNHDSVNKSRYRLRKKLQLDKTTDLDKFVAEM